MRVSKGDPDTPLPAGWDGHERAQLRRLATLPLAEKLQWLEEADELVRHLRRGHASRPGAAKPTRDTTPPMGPAREQA